MRICRIASGQRTQNSLRHPRLAHIGLRLCLGLGSASIRQVTIVAIVPALLKLHILREKGLNHQPHPDIPQKHIIIVIIIRQTRTRARARNYL